jgi:membrane-bound metal-dependent hydrolase YbcI (DUF457 family)
MMGRTHSLSSSVAFLAVLPYLPHASAPEVAVATVCAAGAGLLPDLDHQSGTAARSFGPISHVMCRTVAAVSGGHRHATHSLMGVGVFTADAWVQSGNRWALTGLLWVCLGLAVRSAHHRRHRHDHVLGLANAAGCAVVAYLLAGHVATHGSERMLVAAAVCIGVTAHIAGDLLTPEGCPLVWPYPRRFHVAEVSTDHWTEHHIVMPVLLIAFACLVGARTGLVDVHVVTTTAWRVAAWA